MKLSNEIVLRPRFVKNLDIKAEKILDRFEADSDINTHLKISRVDDHVFIRIPKKEQHFWSPQLHLEIYDIDQKTTLRGLFGPNPTVWTLFMFLHFVVASCFVAAGIWLYTAQTLEKSITIPIISMIVLILLWVLLYASGRLGRHAGKKEMHLQYNYMLYILTKAGCSIQ